MTEQTAIACMYCLTALACTTALSLAVIFAALIVAKAPVAEVLVFWVEEAQEAWERYSSPSRN